MTQVKLAEVPRPFPPRTRNPRACQNLTRMARSSARCFGVKGIALRAGRARG